MMPAELHGHQQQSNRHSKSEFLSNPLIRLAKALGFSFLSLLDHSKKSMHLRKTGAPNTAYHRHKFLCSSNAACF